MTDNKHKIQEMAFILKRIVRRLDEIRANAGMAAIVVQTDGEKDILIEKGLDHLKNIERDLSRIFLIDWK